MAKCTGVRCPMQYGYKVEECNHTDCPYRTEPITNADRIRAMSDEELCNAIKKTYIGMAPWCDHHCTLDDDCKCNTCLKEWLKQPAEV